MALGFSSGAGLFSKGIYVAVEGAAELIRDKATFKHHWTSDLDKWFDDGVDTPGIVLIRSRQSASHTGKGERKARSSSDGVCQAFLWCFRNRETGAVAQAPNLVL